MNLKVICDNTRVSWRFAQGWGFSCLVDGRILFDTGADPRTFFKNALRLKIDLETIKAVVISHDHWDHTGGLWEFLKRRPGLEVYGCPMFSEKFKRKVREHKGCLREKTGAFELTENIFVLGELMTEYKGKPLAEQALVVRTARGTTLITGCAHPGILNMARAAQDSFPGEQLSVVLGGFHLLHEGRDTLEKTADQMLSWKIKKVGPTHCSGRAARRIFKEKYGKEFMRVGAGAVLEI